MENKSHNLTYCSLFQPMVLYSFDEIESTYAGLFWDCVTHSWWFYDMVSKCILRSCVRIFLLIQIPVKTMLHKFHGLCAKSFGNLAKYRYFLRFHDDSRNIFLNTSMEIVFFIFLIMLAKFVPMVWKFQGTWNQGSLLIWIIFSCIVQSLRSVSVIIMTPINAINTWMVKKR